MLLHDLITTRNKIQLVIDEFNIDGGTSIMTDTQNDYKEFWTDLDIKSKQL